MVLAARAFVPDPRRFADGLPTADRIAALGRGERLPVRDSPRSVRATGAAFYAWGVARAARPAEAAGRRGAGTVAAAEAVPVGSRRRALGALRRAAPGHSPRLFAADRRARRLPRPGSRRGGDGAGARRARA